MKNKRSSIQIHAYLVVKQEQLLDKECALRLASENGYHRSVAGGKDGCYHGLFLPLVVAFG